MTTAASVTTLPQLNPAERKHAEQVAAHIRAFISAQGGALGFDTYMRLALYAPGLGYYSAGATKLGGSGDFVTAPEVSSLFSRCLARQVAEVLEITGGDVLELGAGLGTMAADLLSELAALGRLPDRYRILEVSADLAERQRARIAKLPGEYRRAGRVVRPLAGTRHARRGAGQRSAGCHAGGAFRVARLARRAARAGVGSRTGR